MKAQCKTCGKNCEGEYCFQHKPRKQLMSNGKPMRKVRLSILSEKLIDECKKELAEMQEFFLQIWKKRPHKSEVGGDSLGSEALSTYFHHILPKNKYPEAAFDEENIILLTLNEHDQVESDIYRFEEINKRREQLKKKYEIH
jgi:hypothetical protein